ncbi:hypothetical protein N7466_009635 [Penicillium verhagenii]|uniref:uncharacterized protein n=1 Tax=Penicillium verhagenii TaxID=1562060 RepID=UPI00254515D8|nr:uncharacterized protein N7466_009635 [Penicillium verhagenii]KAJ5921309.1 hypothetical protein N7466_009635 [Penicillium verhagenii]
MDVSLLPDFKVLPSEPQYYNPDYNEKTSAAPVNNAISLKTTSSWTYCGPLLSLDPDLLPSSFTTWADATINGSLLDPLLSFLEFVHDFLTTNNISNYWITVRADTGSHEYDIPRWHTDDLFFSPPPPQPPAAAARPHTHRRRSSLAIFNPLPLPYTKRPTSTSRPKHKTPAPHEDEDNTHLLKDYIPPPAQITTSVQNPTNWKLTTTLLGPGTLFIEHATSPDARETQRRIKRAVRAENPGHICASVRCVGCASASESVRARLAAELDTHKVVQARAGEYVFFRVGEELGAVHSEPRSNGDRIFVNVVPGYEADLKCLMAKWGMEFPRAWCVGLPFQMDGGVHWRNVGGV